MTSPALAYGFLLATALAAGYHVVFGRSLRQLPWFWAASVAGFALGQLLAPALPFHLPKLGLLHPLESAVLGVVLMTLVSSRRTQPKEVGW